MWRSLSRFIHSISHSSDKVSNSILVLFNYDTAFTPCNEHFVITGVCEELPAVPLPQPRGCDHAAGQGGPGHLHHGLQVWRILISTFMLNWGTLVFSRFLTTDYVPGIPYQHSRPSGSHYPASTASWRANRRSDHREKMTHLQPPIWVKTWLMKIADDVSVADHGTAVSCAAVVTFYNFSTHLWWLMVDQNILLIRNKVLHRSIKHWLF